MSSSAYQGHLGLHALAKRRQWVCAYCERNTHCPVCNPDLDGQLRATRDHRVPRLRLSRGGSAYMRPCSVLGGCGHLHTIGWRTI